jgi:hypothetical protein
MYKYSVGFRGLSLCPKKKRCADKIRFGQPRSLAASPAFFSTSESLARVRLRGPSSPRLNSNRRPST